MNKELVKRLITSIFMTIITVYSVYSGGLTFNLFLFSILLISLLEWKYLASNHVIFLLGVIFLFSSIIATYLLRYDNLIFFIFVLIISVSSDIGGYIFGKLIKGPKLTQISPNKTYAGMCGSYLLSIFFGIIFLNYYNNFANFEAYSFFSFFIILLISFVNQIGDLLISFFKRLKNVKNTGKILPGHGGLLDRIDGIIFVIPCSHLINIFFI